MAVYFKSEINRRSSNEDSFCDIEFRINHEAAVHLMAVADGMGGLTGGSYYSRTAVSLFTESLLKVIMGEEFMGSPLSDQTDLLVDFCRRVFQEINQELYTRGLNAGIKGGTTLTVVLMFWHSIIIASCGDSPLYFMKEGNLSLGCEIQNAAWRMVKEGKTQQGSLLFQQNKNRLLHYLGRREAVKPFIRMMKDTEADCLLLGTDGAFGDLSAKQIEGLISGTVRRQQLIQDLFDAARNAGEEDNQTAIYYIRDKKKDPPSFTPVSRQDEETAMPGHYKKADSRLGFLRTRILGLKSFGGRDE